MANPIQLEDLGTTWTDYDGDEAYRDYLVGSETPPTITNATGYVPGLARIVAEAPEYLHNDHLGTLRATTNSAGTSSGGDVYTAFGERISGTADRFGYVGAFGYQAATSDTAGDPYVTEFPFLHVGTRYYDPSSGRFLQRDPIGLEGDLNVYAYAELAPTIGIDPMGHAMQSFWPPNTGRFRYGPSRGPGRPPGSYAFRFPGPKGGPHLWGAAGAGAFGMTCAVAVGTGIVAGRAIDNGVANSNNGFGISDGLADLIYNGILGGGQSDYNPWG
jgi:RHS repeat-associated protein